MDWRLLHNLAEPMQCGSDRLSLFDSVVEFARSVRFNEYNLLQIGVQGARVQAEILPEFLVGVEASYDGGDFGLDAI